ncbi:restriction endonuclease subunit S [Demequina phytophila]|uniref:restriction endonuclease subunit S n=1 Tax=Demequina phytophila TaxID=1638981 RepID=UPI0009E3011D|nr:restriction endonuclease subunit S [Demequina phytophila]
MSRIDDLIAKQCPSGVRFASIGEVAAVSSGATPSKSVTAYWVDGTIPWLSSGEVNKETIYQADTLISQSGYDSCSTKMIPPGAVVMALAGQGKTRGTVARTRLECCTNQSLAAIVPDEALDGDFLFHFLRTQYSRLRDLSSGDGTRGGLNLAMIRSYKVPVPPLEVQREIVRILDTFTELEADLEVELQSEVDARRQQHDYYRDAILRPTREAGQVVRLADVAEVISGFAFKSNEFSNDTADVALLRGDNIGQGKLNERPFKRWHRAPNDGLERYELLPGDVVLAMDRPWVPAGLKWARITDQVGPALLVQRVARLRPRTATLSQQFLGALISSPAFTRHVLAVATGNTVPHISGAQIGSFAFQLPSLARQLELASKLEDFDAKQIGLHEAVATERAQRRTQYEHYRDRLLTFKELGQ